MYDMHGCKGNMMNVLSKTDKQYSATKEIILHYMNQELPCQS